MAITRPKSITPNAMTPWVKCQWAHYAHAQSHYTVTHPESAALHYDPSETNDARESRFIYSILRALLEVFPGSSLIRARGLYSMIILRMYTTHALHSWQCTVHSVQYRCAGSMCLYLHSCARKESSRRFTSSVAITKYFFTKYFTLNTCFEQKYSY